MARPVSLPEWATTPATGDLIDPGSLRKASGFRLVGGVPEKPLYQTFNWWMNSTWNWVNYFSEVTDAEFEQIKKIDGAVFSPTQWTYLAGLANVVMTDAGQLRPALGSAAAPTYSFGTDVNTGLYSPGADQVGLATGGVGRLLVSATGEVTVPQLTANTVLVVGTGGLVTSSGITTTKLGYLTDVTGNIGAALALKANLASPTFTGTVVAPTVEPATTAGGTLTLGATANVINIGRAGTAPDASTINFYGSVMNLQVTNSAIVDKLVRLNSGGGASTGNDVGFEVEEGGTAAGYFKTAVSRTSWDLKAPGRAGVFSFVPNTGNFTATFTTPILTAVQTYAFQLNGGTIPSVVGTIAAGDVIFAGAGGNSFSRLAKGTAGQVLAMNTGATAPEWVTPDPGGLQSVDVNSATGNTPLTDKRNYLADTSAGGFTLTLPVGGSKKVIRITDARETFGTNNLTVAPAAGEYIDGLAMNETLILDVDGTWAEFSWSTSSSRWVVSTSTATTSTPAIIQGGQSLGAPMVIGTTDAQPVNIITNGTNAISASATGSVTIGLGGFTGNHFAWGRTIALDVGDLTNGSLCAYVVNEAQANRFFCGSIKNNNEAAGCGFFYTKAANNGGNYYYFTGSDGLFRMATSTANIYGAQGVVVGTQTSDERLKENIRPLPYGLKEALAFDPIMFERDGKTDIGYGAQRTRKIIPEAVYDTGEEIIAGEEKKLAMQYVSLIPVLHNSIKELHAEIVTLRNEIAILKGDKQ